MSNSSLISCKVMSPNHSGKRTHAIDRISIHCMAGNLSVESCGAMFAKPSREASSNYGIGSDGRIALYVDEANRSWCTSSRANDQRAITIEVANTQAKHPWPVSDKAYASLVNLVADICKRNGRTKLIWIPDKENALAYEPKAGEMVLTVHRWFANKACPGDDLYNDHPDIVKKATAKLGGKVDTVPVTPDFDFKVGDIVEFTGTKHYVSSNSSNGKACKPGKARVTAIAKSGKHPIHLVREQGGTATVYGWVDVSFVAREKAPLAVGAKVKVNKGAKTYTGGNLASFVYSTTYDVIEISGDRVVIGKGKAVTAAMNKKDLTVV